jgi:acetyl esterase/lipase
MDLRRLHPDLRRAYSRIPRLPFHNYRTGNDSSLDAVRHPLWNNRNNRGAWTWYMGCAPGAAQLPPYASPARRDSLVGLPPAWIGLGNLDLFHAESLAYADRLGAAGVPCKVHLVDGAPHGFDVVARSATLTREFTAAYQSFLRERLSRSA